MGLPCTRLSASSPTGAEPAPPRSRSTHHHRNLGEGERVHARGSGTRRCDGARTMLVWVRAYPMLGSAGPAAITARGRSSECRQSVSGVCGKAGGYDDGLYDRRLGADSVSAAPVVMGGQAPPHCGGPHGGLRSRRRGRRGAATCGPVRGGPMRGGCE